MTDTDVAMQLLRIWRQLNPENREALLAVVEALTELQRAEAEAQDD